ncbi:unnamed protein product [Schistosoma mattheei]|uniref:Uncharacterized protein n=1 Tax=Schistosoma mattheei TaxID=31246 RepID=A0A3P8HV27_9TREM|nr:unnamed protein product [Schistosoma mattheei]
MLLTLTNDRFPTSPPTTHPPPALQKTNSILFIEIHSMLFY